MASYTWSAVSGGDWNTAADWTPNGIPANDNSTTFDTGGNAYTVTGNAAALSVGVAADDVTFTGLIALDGTAGFTATDNAQVTIASTGQFLANTVDFAAGTLLQVSGTLSGAGGTADVALVTGTGAQWTNSLDESEAVTLNQLYVSDGGLFMGDVNLNAGGTVNLDTTASFSQGGTLDLAGNGTVYVAEAAGAATGSYVLEEAIHVTADAILTLAADPGVAESVFGGIAGAGSVAVTSGTLDFFGGGFNGANTYTGGTNVLDATLTLTGAGAAGTGAIFLDNGALILQADSTGAGGRETVVGAGGHDTVSAASGSVLVFGAASGTLTFTGGAGSATVVGGAGGVLDATGGTGGDAIYGSSSGQDALVTGTGPTTLASAFGGMLTALGGAANTLVAAGGNTTLAGAASTGDNAFYTSGSGTTVVEAGSGTSTVVASGAVNSIFGATGTQDVFLSGSGVTQFDFVSGFEGGTNDIAGFGAGDTLHLTGYADGAAQAAVASAVVVGGNKVLTLSDDTRIVLFGFTGVGSATFT